MQLIARSVQGHADFAAAAACIWRSGLLRLVHAGQTGADRAGARAVGQSRRACSPCRRLHRADSGAEVEPVRRQSRWTRRERPVPPPPPPLQPENERHSAGSTLPLPQRRSTGVSNTLLPALIELDCSSPRTRSNIRRSPRQDAELSIIAPKEFAHAVDERSAGSQGGRAGFGKPMRIKITAGDRRVAARRRSQAAKRRPTKKSCCSARWPIRVCKAFREAFPAPRSDRSAT